ncbi:glutathione peroxidase [Nocardia sp. BMG111209]|uniref:glutathione peroxidase n=1 Tax=Nocardia sp. BMG111209 TaxID=1160137 RepID=UPI000476675E|nr:glutathione peroxidase [Nocardia sp. BMG111209]
MSVYEYSVTTADGQTKSLGDYKDRVVLIVNVASKCGFTPQYAGLEALHQATEDRGLDILGFPCNQFGDQEPGTNAEIQDFCSTEYGVTFPVFAKLDVNGANADPLYTYLRAEAPGDFGPDAGMLYEHIAKNRPETIGTDEVKWNFTKFLVGRDGEVIRRYESTATPEEIGADIALLLD